VKNGRLQTVLKKRIPMLRKTMLTSKAALEEAEALEERCKKCWEVCDGNPTDEMKWQCLTSRGVRPA